MDRPVGPERDWKIVNRLLVRHFAGWSAAFVMASAAALLMVQPKPAVAVGALVGGGWMFVNGLTIAWMGARALRLNHRHPARHLAGFLAAVMGSLLLGVGVVMFYRPSLAGLTIGFSIPLAVFLFELRQLRLALQSNAR